MDRWRCPEIIFALAEIACVMRVNDAQASCAVRSKAEEYAAKFSARTKLIACEAVELSSSEIRRRIRLGADVEELVPRGAAEIITARGLYRM